MIELPVTLAVSAEMLRSFLGRAETISSRVFFSTGRSSLSSGRVTDVLGSSEPQAWHPDRATYRAVSKRRNLSNKLKVKKVPVRFKGYDEEFAQIVSFESQLQSLEKRGFLRPYKAYEPPSDLDERFMGVCSEAVPRFRAEKDLKKISLNRDSRAKLLSALEREFGHRVPNSLLHTMTSVDHVLLFYSTPVDVSTPYEKLHEDAERGRTPPNLHVQRFTKRYSPDDPHPYFSITAFPTIDKIYLTPEDRKKYKDITWDKSPWVNSLEEWYEKNKK